MKNYLNFWKQSFNYSGTLGRSQYWTAICVSLWITILFVALDVFLLNNIAPVPFMAGGIFVIISLIPTLAATVRRLHDTSRSGWWLLVSLIPVIGQLLMITYLAQRATAEEEYENRGFGTMEVDEEFDPEEVYGKDFWNVEEEAVAEGESEGEALSVENHIPGKIF